MADEAFSLRGLAVSAYGPTLLFGLGEGAILPVIPLSANAVGANAATAAALVMLINVGSLLFNVPASMITARFGERGAIVGAAGVGAMAAVLCWWSHSLPALAIGAFLIGVAGSVFALARQSYLTEAVPMVYRARALSTLGGVMRIGIFAGPFIGAAAIGWWGLRSAYAVCMLALIVAGGLAATLPDLPARASSAGSTAVVRTILREQRRTLLTVGMGVVLVSAIRASRQAVIPLWAAHIGLSAQTASLIYGIAGGVDMLVFYPAGKVMDLYGRRWVTVPSMLVMGISMMAIPLTGSALMLGIVSCVLGFGNGIGSGMIMTLGADFAPQVGRTQFLGIWRALSDTGATGGPALLSGVTALVSLGPAVVASGAVGLVAAAVMWRSVPARSAYSSKLWPGAGKSPDSTSAR